MNNENTPAREIAYTDYSVVLELSGATMLQEFQFLDEAIRTTLVEISSKIELSKIAHGRTLKDAENMVYTNPPEILSYLVSCIFLIKMVIGVEEYSKFVKQLETSATAATAYNQDSIDGAYFNSFLKTHEWYVALVILRMLAAKMVLTLGNSTTSRK